MSDKVGWSIEEAFDRAISREEQAVQLYVWASKRAALKASRDLLLDLADEERRHRERLQEAKRGEAPLLRAGGGRVEDLKIVDYLEDVELSEDSGFQEILIYAGKKEKESYDYYKSLEERFQGTELGRLFHELAEEELSHKYKIEKIYDSEILREE